MFLARLRLSPPQRCLSPQKRQKLRPALPENPAKIFGGESGSLRSRFRKNQCLQRFAACVSQPQLAPVDVSDRGPQKCSVELHGPIWPSLSIKLLLSTQCLTRIDVAQTGQPIGLSFETAE